MDQTQNSRDWFNLPQELLELIFKHLIFSDQVRFGSVCKLWFLIASQKPYPPSPELPWLLNRELRRNSEVQQYYEFFSFQEKRTYKLDKLPKTPNIGTIRGSFHGWFFSKFESGHEYYLLNPFSKVTIQLPDHLMLRFPDVFAKAVVLSSEQYTIIAMLFPDGGLALCKVGDTKWHCTNLPPYVDITFYNGQLYGINRTERTVDVFIIDDVLSPRLVNKINSPVPGHNFVVDTYLVESGKDLLVVKRFYTPITALTTLFEVFKLQENQTITPQWIKTTNLSNQVLLVLARDSSLSVPAAMFPGLKGNQIIFNNVGNLSVFSLEDGSIKPFPTPISNYRLGYPICIKPMPASRCDLIL